MHPIEHLRYVARARGADTTELVREAAAALGSLDADRAELVIACRRVVQRHPEAGPLWWMAARVLIADSPARLAWDIAAELDDDVVARRLAAALPDDATVVTIGWPTIAGAALMRRGDATIMCADSGHEASAFMQRLERHGVECEPVAAESLAHAIAAADLVLIECAAASTTRLLAPVGSHVVAAVAVSLRVPVWCAVGVGRRLPREYVDAIAARTIDGRAPCEIALDDVPLTMISRVATVEGVATDIAVALAAECALVPELLRTGPI